MALSDNKEVKRQDGKILAYDVADDESIYKGAAVVINDSGELEAGTDAANKTFTGIAVESNSEQVLGEEQEKGYVRVFKDGVYEMNYEGTAAIGETAYLVDDETVNTDNTSTTSSIAVGHVVEVDSGSSNVRVRIDNAVDATEVFKTAVGS